MEDFILESSFGLPLPGNRSFLFAAYSLFASKASERND